MAYFIYDNFADAQAASASRWASVLGRAPTAQEVTQFAWRILIGLNGQAAVDASKYPTAVPPTTGLVGPSATLDSVNWPSPSLIPLA